MKKMMKLFGFIAVAAMSLTACQNDIDEQVNVNNEGVTLEVVADMGTRSYFGEKEDAGYPSTWTGNEKVQFAANDGTGFTVTNTESGATTHLSATFTTGTTTNDGVIFAMSPVGDYKNGKGGWGSYSWSYGNVYLTIPAVQTPIEQSVDEAAHILFAEHNYEGAFPTGTIGMAFKHALAYGKMTLTLPEGVEASQVVLNFTQAVAGNSIKYYVKDYNTYKKGDFSGADQNTITLNAGNVVDGVYWFGLLPIGVVAEDMVIEVVATNGNIYKKTIAVGGDLEFNQGVVSSFKVNMSACTPEVTNNFVDNAYNLITSVNDLEEGDKVVFVAHKYNKAMGAQNSNNRASVTVVKDTENNTVDFDTKVAIFTVEAGKTAGNFAFKTSGNKYIYAAGGTSSNHLKEEATLSTNSSWVVSIATNGVATIKAENTATTRNWLRYNNATTNGDLFSCYSSGQADICIYKLVGEYTPADPAIEYSIADCSIAFDAISGSANMTSAYATGWSFNATTDAAWISNITVASNAVTFSSEANESEEARSATITVVASREGYSDVTKTFTVSQAGKPSGDITQGATYSYTFTASQFTANGTKKLGTLNWTLAGNGGYWGYDGTKGQQLGSGSKPYKSMTLTTTGYEGGVKTIKINTSGASSINGSFTVTVGGKQIGAKTTLTTTATTYTLTSDELLVGDIVISYTQTSSKALYIKSIAIN